MQHSFNVELATKYGILEAILLENIYFWIKKNEANNKNFYDGRYWTYNSIKAFSEMFPYVSGKQIRTALDKLIKNDVIMAGNYNKVLFDRTLWYAFTDNGNSQMQLTYKSNQNCPISQISNDQGVIPIPDINTDIKPDNKEIIKEIIDYLNNKGGTSFTTTNKRTVSLINARINQGYTLDDFKDVIWHCWEEWVIEPKKFSNGQMSDTYFRPSTLFNETNFENYLQEYRKKIEDE